MKLFGLEISRAKQLPLPQPRSAYQIGGGATFELNQSFAELVKQGMYQNAAVQGCISAYTMTLSEPPLYVMQNGVEQEEHPLSKLLQKPNKAMSCAQLLSFIASFAYIGGNCYVVKVRGAQGNVVGLYPYHDGQISPVPSQYEWIDHYEYKVDNVTKIIPADDVIHFRSHIIDPLRPHKGMSPILAAARGVDIYGEMEKIIYSTLKNDGMPRGMLSFPPEAAMSPQQIDLLREQFGDNYGGAKRGRTAVMSGGATYERLSFNLEELQADNIISRAEVAICQAFRVHPLVAMTYAGLMNSTYSNMEEAFKQFTTLTRVPIWNAWEETFEQGFAAEYPDIELEFDMSHVEALQPSMESVQASAIQQFQANIITQNEARVLLGQAPIIEGDVFTYQLNPMAPLGTEPIAPQPEGTYEPPEVIDEDDFPSFEGEVTHDYLGKQYSEQFEMVEWKRQDDRNELYVKRIAKDFAKVAADLERTVLTSVKTRGGASVKAEPFNFSVWVKKFVEGTKRSFNALVTNVVGDSLEQAGTTIEEFGNTNFEATLKEATNLSTAQITESVGTIRDELRKTIETNANLTADELSTVIKNQFEVIKTSRADLIGRTTTTSVAGKTQRETWKKRNTQIEDPNKKIVPVWTSRNDGKVRSAHSAINRTSPNAEGYWSLNGARVAHPGDPNAAAKDSCNCRCVLVPTRAGRI